MAERDLPSRLRRAVKENNLFLVKRLIQRTGMRNPDPEHKRYTSLAWAAALGNEETFEFLLNAGHDDEWPCKDVENNTVLHILADTKGASVTSPYHGYSTDPERVGSALRMSKFYWERYPDTLDWSNDKGRTALHVAALKGSEELVQIFCDLGADIDLTDNEGNTPLHYASAWGHVSIIQLLVERGCQYTLRNNEGYTASDFAYSSNTKDTLQHTAQNQFEFHKRNKKARRNFAAAIPANGTDWPPESPPPPPVPPKSDRDLSPLVYRGRSESGASASTGTSDSNNDHLGVLRHQHSQSSLSTTSSPSQASIQGSAWRQPTSATSSTTSGVHSPPPSQSSALLPGQPSVLAAGLSPVATRMLERDADAMEKFRRSRPRQRSGSADTGTPDVNSNGALYGLPSLNDPRFVSAGPSSNGDDITALAHVGTTGIAPPRRRLRPSASASQLGSQATYTMTDPERAAAASRDPSLIRTRAGTGPAELTLKAPENTSPVGLTPPASSERVLFHSPTAAASREYVGPPADYARFPEPTSSVQSTSVVVPAEREAAQKTPTQPTSTRSRLPFKLSKSGSADQKSHNHRRGSSGTASPISPPSFASSIMGRS